MGKYSFSLTIAFAMFTGFSAPRPAHAWDAGPVCAFPASIPDDIAEPAETLMCDPTGLQGPQLADTPATPETAREALTEARRLAAAGRSADAVLRLSAVVEAEPELSDRIALEEAGYRMAAGPDAQACQAWERARQSPQRTVAARGRIGYVGCLLATGDRDGIEEFEALRRTYPELPQVANLELLLASAHVNWGDEIQGGQIYRRIDLMYPGSAAATLARARLTALRASGLELREHTPTQRVDRAERLVRSGPLDMAREAITELRSESLPGPLAQRVARFAARMARHEGRWDDATSLLREARGLPGLEAEEREAVSQRLTDMVRASEARDAAEVTRRIRGLTRGRRIESLPTARIFAILRVAARGGEAEVVTRAATTIAERERMPPGLRLDAALLAAGIADDEVVARLLEAPARHPSFRVAANYHRARALERLGRSDEAQTAYEQVIEDDSEVLPYYAMWSRQRLLAMRGAETPTPVVAPAPPSSGPIACEPYGPFTLASEASGKTGRRPAREGLSALLPAPSRNPYEENAPEEEAGAAPIGEVAPVSDEPGDEAAVAGVTVEPIELSDAELIGLLRPLAAEHGEAFPWLPRALGLVRLGERAAASDEVYETYLAWRDASGQGSARADLEGVLRGRAPPRHRVSGATWRARRTFPAAARQTLATVAAALGDNGVAIQLTGSFELTGPRPRAYRALVETAAARHGVQPELLWAVMRVESIYNPRIISYAGAIGLMQIMPRTGRLIAHGQGRTDFTVDQLLDPATNIDMAAWYLASLIERFDGRLPLAIASYNGGPHNVRRWMRDHSPDMPLDAFLERIPFTQTHRYVRRVMTHFEAYLAQSGAVIEPIDTRLPAQAGPDAVAF